MSVDIPRDPVKTRTEHTEFLEDLIFVFGYEKKKVYENLSQVFN
jgi:hypothetical protein